MTPIIAIVAPCNRCGIIARLDRCGHCEFCQFELAYGKPRIDWDRFVALWAARGWHWKEAA